LRHAVAGHRTALRYPLQHALRIVRSLDPARPLASAARPALRRTWRCACGDTPEPSAVVIDSRSRRSAPSCFTRGIDGGKKIRGVKIQMAVEKYGIPPWRSMSPQRTAMTRKPSSRFCVSSRMAAFGGQPWGTSATGANGWLRPVDMVTQGPGRLSRPELFGITVEAIARGRDGQFIPAGICWVVERSFAWAEPLPPVEYHLRALEGAPHRFRCDRVHLDPLSPPQASRRRGTQRLTSTNRH
jgi:hypothetical protein